MHLHLILNDGSGIPLNTKSNNNKNANLNRIGL